MLGKRDNARVLASMKVIFELTIASVVNGCKTGLEKTGGDPRWNFTAEVKPGVITCEAKMTITTSKLEPALAAFAQEMEDTGHTVTRDGAWELTIIPKNPLD